MDIIKFIEREFEGVATPLIKRKEVAFPREELISQFNCFNVQCFTSVPFHLAVSLYCVGRSRRCPFLGERSPFHRLAVAKSVASA